jgi:cation diffusion facilitator CzcD-associated flavoprotein CzcO
MAYSDFPMPADYPDFPHHAQVAAYFDAYVDHFGLRQRITFETAVEHASPVDGGWRVTLEGGETRDYRALLVANGHHWDPQMPSIDGMDVFAGVQLHSHHYLGDDPALFDGKRVVVLGMGNSAMDIAVEAAQSAAKVFLAARRGAWIVPKYVFGRPLDQFVTAPRIPLKVRQRFMETTLRAAVGDMQRYGLPKPDHRPLEAHPTISDTILTRHAQAEHRAADEGHRGLHRRHRGARRRGRLRHGLQGQLPVLRPRARLRARQRAAALQAGLPSRPPRPVLHRAAAAARGDDAAR